MLLKGLGIPQNGEEAIPELSNKLLSLFILKKRL
jgi:hypothetical protein